MRARRNRVGVFPPATNSDSLKILKKFLQVVKQQPPLKKITSNKKFKSKQVVTIDLNPKKNYNSMNHDHGMVMAWSWHGHGCR